MKDASYRFDRELRLMTGHLISIQMQGLLLVSGYRIIGSGLIPSPRMRGLSTFSFMQCWDRSPHVSLRCGCGFPTELYVPVPSNRRFMSHPYPSFRSRQVGPTISAMNSAASLSPWKLFYHYVDCGKSQSIDTYLQPGGVANRKDSCRDLLSAWRAMEFE